MTTTTITYPQETAAIELHKEQPAQITWTPEQVKLVKDTVCKDASDAELQLFLHVCKRTGLDPFARQVYSIVRQGKRSTETSIDGFRVLAGRSREHVGTEGPFFWDGVTMKTVKRTFPDGSVEEREEEAWTSAWNKKEPPTHAKVVVHRKGWTVPKTAVVLFSEFRPPPPNDFMWKKMPSHMLGKVAEAHALRAGFPNELSGLYTSDEMEQAGSAAKEDKPVEAVVEREIPPDFTHSLSVCKTIPQINRWYAKHKDIIDALPAQQKADVRHMFGSQMKAIKGFV